MDLKSFNFSFNNASNSIIPVYDSIECQITYWELFYNLLSNLLSEILNHFIFIIENQFIGLTADNKQIMCIFVAQTYCKIAISALDWR